VEDKTTVAMLLMGAVYSDVAYCLALVPVSNQVGSCKSLGFQEKIDSKGHFYLVSFFRERGRVLRRR
jgi:hypothetical protein